MEDIKNMSPEPIRYDTKSDRELLIVVAESINSLNEKTTALCAQVKEHEKLLELNKDKISGFEIQLVKILSDNVGINKSSADTLVGINKVLDIHSDKISKFELVTRSYWWLVGLGATLVTGIIVYVLKRIGIS